MARARVFACLAVLFAGAARAAPRIDHITLRKHTLLTLTIPYDQGVRFTFPFVLDERDDYVPFTLNITNPVFTSAREPGRNFFVISPRAPQNAPRGAEYIGDAFITAAGYEITIELRAVPHGAAPYTDVVFALDGKAREDLIQHAIAQRTQALEAQYRRKFAGLDQLADEKALARIGHLALSRPDHTRIKQEQDLRLPNGDTLSLYVDEALTYGPYTIFVFDVSTDSNTQHVEILDAKLFSIDHSTAQIRPVDVGEDVPRRVNPDDEVKGTLTALTADLDPRNVLKLELLTDRGTVTAQW